MSVLEGSVKFFALPDVFRLLGNNKVTGALHVSRDSGEGVVYFREGRVYYAHSNLTRELIGQRLVNAKLITHGQLLRILDEQKRVGNRRIGDLLVEKGILAQDMLDTFLREQMKEVIFDLLHWDVGGFTFKAGEESPYEVGLSLRVEDLIMESSRRIDEWAVIRRKIPSVEAVVRLSPLPPPDQAEISIQPEEWTLLALADGQRTVRDIAMAGERTEFDACKVVFGLLSAGLLEVVSSAAPSGTEMPSRLVKLKPTVDEVHLQEQETDAEEPLELELLSPEISEAVEAMGPTPTEEAPEAAQEIAPPATEEEAAEAAVSVGPRVIEEAPEAAGAAVPAITEEAPEAGDAIGPPPVEEVHEAAEAAGPPVTEKDLEELVAKAFEERAARSPETREPREHTPRADEDGADTPQKPRPEVKKRMTSDLPVSKEMLERLIKGVRQL